MAKKKMRVAGARMSERARGSNRKANQHLYGGRRGLERKRERGGISAYSVYLCTEAFRSMPGGTRRRALEHSGQRRGARRRAARRVIRIGVGSLAR